MVCEKDPKNSEDTLIVEKIEQLENRNKEDKTLKVSKSQNKMK